MSSDFGGLSTTPTTAASPLPASSVMSATSGTNTSPNATSGLFSNSSLVASTSAVGSSPVLTSSIASGMSLTGTDYSDGSTNGGHLALSTKDELCMSGIAGTGSEAGKDLRKRMSPYDGNCMAVKKRKGDLLPVLSFECMELYRKMFAPLNREQMLDVLARASSVYDDVYNTSQQIADESPAARRLMIRNISFQTENNSLFNSFNQFGHIEDFTIVREKDTNKSKGFGFVTFKSVSSVKSALDTPISLDGRTLIVKLAADTQSESAGPISSGVGGASIGAITSGGVTASGAGHSYHNSEYKMKRKLFVRNLSDKTTTDRLRAAFAHFGAMEDCVVVQDPMSGRSKGYGFLTFVKQEDALRAVQQSQRIIDDQMAFVAFACPIVAAATGTASSTTYGNGGVSSSSSGGGYSGSGGYGGSGGGGYGGSGAYGGTGGGYQRMPSNPNMLSSPNIAATHTAHHHMGQQHSGTNQTYSNQPQMGTPSQNTASYQPSTQQFLATSQSLNPSYITAAPQRSQSFTQTTSSSGLTLSPQQQAYDPNAAATAAVAAAAAAAMQSAHMYNSHQPVPQHNPTRTTGGSGMSASSGGSMYGTGIPTVQQSTGIPQLVSSSSRGVGGGYQLSQDGQSFVGGGW